MIVRPVSRLVQEYDAKSFTVIGSPCSDGLGVDSLQLFHAGLTGAAGNFTVVLGDASPLGRDPYYGMVSRFINRTSPKPVHVMTGNHDGPDYEEYFGFGDRAVLSEEFVLIMLDNSGKRFADSTLHFMRETMAMVDCRNIIVAFHIPPPNRVTGNSLSADEWQRFEEAVGVWRNRITLLLCGHSHSYYEDDVDGLHLVVTGGGGSRINEVERIVRPPHHALEIGVGDDGCPTIRMRPLKAARDAVSNEEVRALLLDVYGEQCRNHVGHTLDAEAAWRMGHPGLAHLYRAAAESCLGQARFLYHLLEGAIYTGNSGCEHLIGLESGDNRDVLAVHALNSVGRAEKNLEILRDRMLGIATDDGEDIATSAYFICDSCGMVYAGLESPNYCNECGAPSSHFREVE